VTESGHIEIYQTEDGQTRIEVRLEQDTLWLSQTQMAELFDKGRSCSSALASSATPSGPSSTCHRGLRAQREAPDE